MLQRIIRRTKSIPLFAGLAFLLWGTLPAKSQETNSAAFRKYYALAGQAMYNDPEQAVILLDSAAFHARRGERWEDFFLCRFDQIDQFIFTGRPTQARQKLTRVDSLLQLEQFERLPEDLRYENQSYWGEYYRQIGYFEEALDHFEAARRFFKTASQLDARHKCRQLYRINSFIGDLYVKLGQYQNALERYFANISYYECYRDADLEKDSPSYFATNYKLIGDAYLHRGDTTRALAYYQKAEQDLEAVILKHGPQETWYYSWAKRIYKALAEAHLRNPETAREYVNKAIRFHQGDNDREWIYTNKLLAKIYVAENHFDRAESALRDALNIVQQRYGQQFYENARILYALGEIKARQGDYPAATRLYMQACSRLFGVAQIATVNDLPPPDQASSKKDLLEILDAFLNALLQQYHQTGSAQYLESGRKLGDYAVVLIDHIREDFWIDADKEKLIQLSYDIYEMAIESAALSGEAYFPKGFSISEKSKALLLLEAFKNARISEVEHLSPQVIEKEKKLRYEIAYLEEKFRDEQGKRAPEPEKLREIHENITQLREELHQLLKEMEAKNEQFAELVRGNEALTAREVQQKLIDSRQSLLEYFIGARHTYLFLVNADRVELHRLPSGAELRRTVNRLRQGLLDYHLSNDPGRRNPDSLWQASNRQLVATSRSLYRQLIAPVAPGIKEELIIIPDGVLNYLPFELLLSDEPPEGPANFKKLPYLVRKHTISYCYSSTLLKEMQEKKTGSPFDLIAFAPSFPAKTSPQAALFSRRGPVFDTLYHNTEEVRVIQEIFGRGVIKAGETASKAAFLDAAPLHSLIHVATHGYLNDSNSDYSFIAFTQTGEDPENRLYVRELYNIRLKAALVVLSACETGVGELRKGEGLISIARGFSYAGAKSILPTLWAVNDRSTTEIIRTFYRYLKKGYSKSEAIQMAKLDYIDRQIDPVEAHPFFWAAYVPVGDMQAIGYPWLSGVPFARPLIALLLFAGVLMGRRMLRKR